MVVAEDVMVNFYALSCCDRKFQHLGAARLDAYVFNKRIWFKPSWLLIIGLIADIYITFIFHIELIWYKQLKFKRTGFSEGGFKQNQKRNNQINIPAGGQSKNFSGSYYYKPMIHPDPWFGNPSFPDDAPGYD